jgi:hypothetical protein
LSKDGENNQNPPIKRDSSDKNVKSPDGTFDRGVVDIEAPREWPMPKENEGGGEQQSGNNE